ncbi:MAG: thioredoxin family protein [Muribaculaceae bacterium]
MTYDQAIRNTPVTLVEFYASWCPHCHKMMPVVEQIKELLADSVDIIQLDIDNNQEAANANKVDSVPTFIIYKNGEEQWRHSGEIEGNDLLNKIQSYSN